MANIPKRFTIATLALSSYELDGSLDSLIEQLTEYRDEAKRRGLTNVRCDTDYYNRPPHGRYSNDSSCDEQVWTLTIFGDSPKQFKTKLPKKEYDRAFTRGVMAAHNGHERKSDADGTREGAAFYEGFDSVEKD